MVDLADQWFPPPLNISAELQCTEAPVRATDSNGQPARYRTLISINQAGMTEADAAVHEAHLTHHDASPFDSLVIQDELMWTYIWEYIQEREVPAQLQFSRPGPFAISEGAYSYIYAAAVQYISAVVTFASNMAAQVVQDQRNPNSNGLLVQGDISRAAILLSQSSDALAIQLGPPYYPRCERNLLQPLIEVDPEPVFDPNLRDLAALDALSEAPAAPPPSSAPPPGSPARSSSLLGPDEDYEVISSTMVQAPLLSQPPVPASVPPPALPMVIPPVPTTRCTMCLDDLPADLPVHPSLSTLQWVTLDCLGRHQVCSKCFPNMHQWSLDTSGYGRCPTCSTAYSNGPHQYV